ncbi:chaperonin 10-like protein [Mariannaea sp. PMI_226]|nr:chaperonin 10-like protein [Mariannaea sp. PMI_226]
MAHVDYQFEGWMGLDPSAADGKMVWQKFSPKQWEETDVDIKISHCGICGSDEHSLRSSWDWLPTKYPCCAGHEIVGTVVRIGTKVKNGLQVGDRVGVGAQTEACLGRLGYCADCDRGNEQYCPRFSTTACGTYINGETAYGGYASYHRCPAHFAIKIPDNLPSQLAAPMLCGGITIYSPLKHHGCGPGKRVGIIGIGGIGHFGLLFAKALGAQEVVAISRHANKEEEALQLGADRYIATADEHNWADKYARSLDIIVSTVSSADMPMDKYIGLLDTDGILVQVGLPADGSLTAPFAFLLNRRKVTSSMCGSPEEIWEVLRLAAEKSVHPWVQVVPMRDANQALLDTVAGKARFRYVLEN